jgi:NTE family protein
VKDEEMPEKRSTRPLFARPRLGMALSGGGARGLAHIGVLKVMEREGIQIDAIAGTSMGGLIGAAYAAGVSSERMEQEAIRMSQLRELVRLIDWFPPKGKLLDSNRVRQFLREGLQLDVEFSDLRIPLSVMTVDLETNQPRPIRSGSVLRAVEATTAMPGLFKAVDHL